jgi:hypothetical protein
LVFDVQNKSVGKCLIMINVKESVSCKQKDFIKKLFFLE